MALDVLDLTPKRALIFRITHIDNVPWILDNGLHCKSSDAADPNYREIGSPDLIAKREHRVVPVAPGGILSDYIPFYFTPCSPMLYNIKTGYGGVCRRPMHEIVIWVASLRRVAELTIPFVIADRHAYLKAARYSNQLTGLDNVDWEILREKDFRRSDDDPGKIERYQAEALVHGHLPADALSGLVCQRSAEQSALETEVGQRGLALKVITKPNWYFG